MTASASWLPEHQHHALYTLAHVDELIEQTGSVLFDYMSTDIFGLETVADGALAHVKVTRVKPLPEAVSRIAAAAMTQLRAALEHTLFAEVTQQMGRELTEAEARRIEMPATTNEADFDAWAKARKRQDLPPLVTRSDLWRRIRDLQPFNRRDYDNHPLRLLAEHTNLAKHRTPAIAATRLGAVIADHEVPSLITPGKSQPIVVGETIATGPIYERVPISIWPEISMQRPHTGSWHVIMRELSDIERWVREVAVPHLVLGRSDVEPLPPHVSISAGHDDLESAFATRTVATAFERSMTRIQARMVRESLAETLALDPSTPQRSDLDAWIAQLDDDEVLERQGRLSAAAAVRDMERVKRVVGELLDEMTAATAARNRI